MGAEKKVMKRVLRPVLRNVEHQEKATFARERSKVETEQNRSNPACRGELRSTP